MPNYISQSSPNPNDLNAHLYDAFTRPERPPELTQLEVKLISELTPDKGFILDLGCGTGRHAIPLAEKGYKVTGVDSSWPMLQQLQIKSRAVETAHSRATEYLRKYTKKFNTIILMWNALNEIALDQAQADKLVKFMKEHLLPGGAILINISDAASQDMSLLDYETRNESEGRTYRQHAKVKTFDPKLNLTHIIEKVAVLRGDDLIEKVETTIVQKWWKKDEVKSLFENAGLTFEERTIPHVADLYLVGKIKHD